MADNLNVTEGSGKTVAADEVGGALYQRIKIGIGADGEATDLDGGQATMANSVPVVVASDQAAFPTKDAGPNWTSVHTYTTSTDMTTTDVYLTDAPTTDQKIVVTDLIISSDTATLITLSEETSGTVIGAVRIPADGVVQLTPRSKWKLPTANRRLQGLAADAGNIYITAFYYSEA